MRSSRRASKPTAWILIAEERCYMEPKADVGEIGTSDEVLARVRLVEMGGEILIFDAKDVPLCDLTSGSVFDGDLSKDLFHVLPEAGPARRLEDAIWPSRSRRSRPLRGSGLQGEEDTKKNRTITSEYSFSD